MMLAVVLTCSIAVFFFTAAFFSRTDPAADNVSSRLEEIKTIDSETEKKKNSIDFKKLANFLLGSSKKKKKTGDQKKVSKSTKKLDKLLMLAGFDFNASQWNALKYGSVLLLGATTYVIAGKFDLDDQTVLLAAGGVAAVVLFLFSNAVTSRVKKKKESIRTQLPDIIDLLVVSVEAGLGFDAALLRLYEKNKCPIMQELVRTQQDVQRGISKKDAYAALIERCDCKEITSFANAIVQSESMGISMKSVLTSQSESLREERTNRAQEQAEKAPVKMMLPMVLFIFPCIFIILLAPAAANIIGAMG